MKRTCLTLLSLWILAALSPLSHAGSSAGVGISANVLVVCEVTQVSRQVRGDDDDDDHDDDDEALLITVVLNDNCNAVHRLRVLFPSNLPRGEDRLQITLDNTISPDISLPGERSFTGLPPGLALRTLLIRYASEKGTRREAFVSGLVFDVSAP